MSIRYVGGKRGKKKIKFNSLELFVGLFVFFFFIYSNRFMGFLVCGLKGSVKISLFIYICIFGIFKQHFRALRKFEYFNNHSINIFLSFFVKASYIPKSPDLVSYVCHTTPVFFYVHGQYV